MYTDVVGTYVATAPGIGRVAFIATNERAYEGDRVYVDAQQQIRVARGNFTGQIIGTVIGFDGAGMALVDMRRLSAR